MEMFTLEFFGLLAVMIVLFIVLWIITDQVRKRVDLLDDRKQESVAQDELLSQPRKWTRNETLIAAHIALYSDRSIASGEFVDELASRLERSSNSVNRKIKRIIYLDTDNGSKMDRDVVTQLVEKGEDKSRKIFKEMIVSLTGSSQWLQEHKSCW